MLPSKTLRLQVGTSLAAATPLSQATNANVMRLVKAAFTESEDLVPADLTFADFTGSTAIAAPLEDAQVGVDPVTGQQRITVDEPAGSWRWITGDAVNLPQTIYGYAYLTQGSAAVIGVKAFDTPITLSEAGQEINLGTVSMDVVLQPMS